MTAAVSYRWAPQRMNATIAGAFAPSVRTANRDANIHLHNKSKSSVGLRVVSTQRATLFGKGLASTFEKGRKGGYLILPAGLKGTRRSFSRTRGETFSSRGTSARRRGQTQAMLGSSGSAAGKFFKSAIGGPMRAYPAMGPAGSQWARQGYHAEARRHMARAGFR